MAIPAQPTSTTIVTEAWKLFGKANPTTSEITRGTDYGLEIVKSDLSDQGYEWDFARTVSFQPTLVGVSSYQAPTDYAKLIYTKVYDGARRGTAQSVTANTITLAANDSGQSETVGKKVAITGATLGSGQCLQIKSYNTSTKQATLEANWDTTPTGTITYLVVDDETEIKFETVYDKAKLKLTSIAGKPTMVYHLADSAEGDFVFDRTPDKLYVVEFMYYADLLKIDLTATLYNRILRLLNGLFIQGVFVWCLQDDARYATEYKKYEMKLSRTAAKYLHPNNLSNVDCKLDYE